MGVAVAVAIVVEVECGILRVIGREPPEVDRESVVVVVVPAVLGVVTGFRRTPCHRFLDANVGCPVSEVGPVVGVVVSITDLEGNLPCSDLAGSLGVRRVGPC